MQDIQRVQVFFFNGCHGSYRKMVRRLYPGKEPWEVSNCLHPDGSPSMPWIDNNGYHPARFTGVVIFHENGLMMKKGDHYMVPLC
jgi:hypothetical protein